MAAIVLERVDKHFGARQVLHGVDFRVGPGEIVGLLGPNGSGKTTTLRLVAGYYRPDAGCVRIEEDGATAAAVGYLPERAPLYDALSVQHYLAFVGQCKGLGGRALDAGLERALSAFDLQAVRRTAIGRLSKGFRQRVGLAQAVLGDPSVLLLDEATNGLDPMQIVEARRMIREAATGRAVIFSSHLMQEVQALCTRALILRQGRVIADLPLRDGAAADGAVVLLRWRGADVAGLCEALQALPGVTAVSRLPADAADAADQGAGDRVRLRVQHERPPAALDALLRCALARGQVLDARRDATSVETLLLQAVARADAGMAIQGEGGGGGESEGRGAP